jgi:hypothetical protein
MEANMRQPDPAKKLPPSLARHCGHIECCGPPLPAQPLEQGNEPGRKRKFREVRFMPFCPECNNTSVSIYVREGDTSFGEPATLLPCDNVTNLHPVERTIIHWQEYLGKLKSIQDNSVLDLSDAWLTWRSVRSDTEPGTGVNAGVPAKYGFKHDNPKKLYFVESSIFAALISAVLCVAMLTPLDKISHMLPRQLPGHSHVVKPKIDPDIFPRVEIPTERFKGVRIPLLEETRHPGVPMLAGGKRVRHFAGGKLASERVRFAGFGGDVEPKFCTTLSAYASDVVKLRPPKWRT